MIRIESTYFRMENAPYIRLSFKRIGSVAVRMALQDCNTVYLEGLREDAWGPDALYEVGRPSDDDDPASGTGAGAVSFDEPYEPVRMYDGTPV